ncbi:MAG: DoxX family protein [Elusimicrobia bacterium]|nr:DoxX family protein [Elusimicrobiota bacterium]
MKPSEKADRAPENKLNWILFIIRVVVGGIFLASGFFKLLEAPEDFAAAMEAYEILPPALIAIAARVVPWVELFAGGFLAAGCLTRWAAVICGGFSSVFFLLLAATKIRGISLAECGCFGKLGPHLEPWQTMILDAVLISFSAYLIRQKETPLALDNWINRGS